MIGFFSGFEGTVASDFISDEKSVIIQISIYLNVMCHFLLALSKSFHSHFTMMCLGMIFFGIFLS